MNTSALPDTTTGKIADFAVIHLEETKVLNCAVLGSQYCSHHDQKILRQYGFKVDLSHIQASAAGQRMSGKSTCYDNAAVKTFFKTIKAELIWRRSWGTRRKAEMAIFEYINGSYNPRRRLSAIRWKSPLAFERKAA